MRMSGKTGEFINSWADTGDTLNSSALGPEVGMNHNPLYEVGE